MTFIKNSVISILIACLCAMIITACTPKNANNTGAQSSESTGIVTDFSDTGNEENAETVRIDDFVIRDGELAAYFGGNRVITLPREFGITSIGQSAFAHSSVASIIIPKEIRSINEYAFENCNSLQSITVDEDNQYYASVDGALFNKQKTNMIYFPHGKTGDFTIPGTVTVINEYAFNNRSGITSLTIPTSVTQIGTYGSVFDGTVRLSSITVDPNNRNYASVDGVLFNKAVTEYIHFPQGKTGSYTIPNTITGLGNYIMRGRGGITSITIPNSVTSIGEGAFYECSSLTSIDIPGSVTNIGGSAFYGCTAIASVTLHEGLASIGEQAFFNCAITSINIPASVTRIGSGAFAASDNENWYWAGEGFTGSSRLASITVDQRNQNYTSVDGVLFNKAVTELIHFPQGKGGSYTIPNTVTGLTDFAFSYRNGLTSVTIPASVTSIGANVFFGCSKLTAITVDQNNQNYASEDGVLFNKEKDELIRFPRGKTGSYTIPNTVESIGKNAFARAGGLTSITIPSSVTSIGETAFAATGLKTLTLPNSITHIGSGAFTDNQELQVVGLPDNYYAYEEDGKGGAYFFYGCLKLERFIASRNNKHYSTVDGALLSKDGKRLIRVPQGRQGSYTIPNTVTSIAYKAFYKAEKLTSVTIPNSVLNIGDFAFDGSGITSADIPNSVISIGKYAFTRCAGLASVNIPASVTSIGDFAFYHCTGLRQFNVDQSNKNFFLANGVLSNRENENYSYSIRTMQQDDYFAQETSLHTSNSVNER